MTTPPSTGIARASRFPPQLALSLMVAIWAANFSIVKQALEHIGPLAFNALRFPFAALTVLAALRLRGPLTLPRPGDRLRVVLLGLLGNVVYQGFFIHGLALTRAGTASVILAGTPVVTALLSAAAGHERIDRRTWAGVLATVIGVALVVGAGFRREAGGSPAGNLLLVGACLSWAVYTVGTRPLIPRYGTVAVTAWTLVSGTIGVVAVGLPELWATDLAALRTADWLAVLYAGALSVGVAYLIWNHGVRTLGNTRTAAYSNLQPAAALGFAWLLLAEVPTPWQLGGATIIIAGVSLAQPRPHRPPIRV